MPMENEAKVLIIGNGFDLAHRLPTSYHDFITFVKILDEFEFNWSGERVWKSVAFGDVFREKLGEGIGFSSKTVYSLRKYYDVDILHFDLSLIEGKLDNAWLNYFKPIHGIETWIDFENEIEKALKLLEEYVKLSNSRVSKGESFHFITHDISADKNNVFIQRDEAEKLHRLNLIQAKDIRSKNITNSEAAYYYQVISKYSKNNNEDGMSGVSISKIIDYLIEELHCFKLLFSIYLKYVIGVISSRIRKNQLNLLESFSKNYYSDIYSFNYTNTVNSFYNENAVIWNVHGSVKNIGELNVVLGVDEVDTTILGTSVLSFTKYFQTLFNETDFEFLDYVASPANHYDGVDYFIWGHSLDKSDQKYIKRLFHEISFNAAKSKSIAFDVVDAQFESNKYVPKSTITVYYHDQASKARLLKNLLEIIGKEVIEKSIISNHLRFEQSPEVLKDNF